MSDEALAEFEDLQARLRMLDQSMSQMESTLQELRQAEATLEALDGLESDEGALIPIGGGYHVRASLAAKAPVVAPVGRGYAADQSPADAVAELKARIQEFSSLLSQRSQEADRLAQRAQQLATQLQAQGGPDS